MYDHLIYMATDCESEREMGKHCVIVAYVMAICRRRRRVYAARQ